MSAPSDPAEPSLAALGALLDRSLVQIADAARDARTFDRETIRALSDAWDNTTFPLFRAATGRTPRARERRARAALEWMARLRPTRWDWMVEQGAIAGHRIDALLQPPPALFDKPYRDYRGTVRPAYHHWRPQTLTDLADDYLLGASTIRHLQLERAGTRLCAFLVLELVRSYDHEANTPGSPPTLEVHLDEVSEAAVDTGAAPGAGLGSDARGASIALGSGGLLRAREASLRLDDPSWHLSSAGRRAGVQTPPRQAGSRVEHPPQEGKLEGCARGAATFLLWAMMRIRSVRYPGEVTRIPVEAYCRALHGAGHDILVAGALPARRREAAFRSLVATWLRHGGIALAPDWKRLLKDMPDAAELARATREDLAPRGFLPPVLGPAREVTGVADRAELRMASYTAEHTDMRVRREARAMVHLAVPAQEEGAPWRLRVLNATDPLRFRARTGAFERAGQIRIDQGTNEPQPFMVGDDALTLDARAWSQEPPLD
ncbi:hypothetical protein NE857_26410 [Nocardiopsis exhalans]|uniref:Uncharacterized protein n=1 Tax=Nocardiopsis exhalans TaxID=163604 RepID=A0ABY5D329_9ACTN|nr:hypothetical protein [Nocardiopsis exhalans]USY18784.1 hypothetical protein NE857_26410 [Nocardiopsis exhalans]